MARQEQQRFESAIWLRKARSMPAARFKREVEKHLTGQETEAAELVYFRVYKSQLPVIEQALGLMLGTNKSRGYCLEMICADFLAGAGLESRSPRAMLLSMCRLYELLPDELKQTFSARLRCGSRHEGVEAATPAPPPRGGSVPEAPSASSRTRWVAVPALWQSEQSAGASHSLEEPTRG